MAWRTVSLDGEKNSSNKAFTIPFVPREPTVKIVQNGAVLHRITGTAQIGEYTLNGTAVAVGLAPNSGGTLTVQAQEL